MSEQADLLRIKLVERTDVKNLKNETFPGIMRLLRPSNLLGGRSALVSWDDQAYSNMWERDANPSLKSAVVGVMQPEKKRRNEDDPTPLRGPKIEPYFFSNAQ